MHASFAHSLKPTGRSWHCEDGTRSILSWLRQRDAHGSQRERPRLPAQIATIENTATSPQAGAVFFQANPAGVALPDRERCPPKAEVVSSNLAGSANHIMS